MSETSASILIVDDDEAICNLLRACLEPTYCCAAAGSADEAISLLEAGSFKLVMSDIKMPGRSGLELCEYVQENSPRTVVIMISGMTDIQCSIGAMRRGAFDYVTKPFDLAELTLAVDRALRFQQALEERFSYEQALEERVRTRTEELRFANDELNVMLDALYRNYRATLRGLARTLEARDIETRGHSDRVVAYSIKLGKRLGLSPNELIALEQGALLHDIGKIGVPDSILLKTGPLTSQEWLIMREHVAHGLRIIADVEFLSGARFVLGQHHERYDGSGYPNGLRGDEIHIHARIFAVADAFDAITSDRPYRAAQGYEEACKEILANSGSDFDPKVVRTFLTIPEEEWDEIRRRAHSEHLAEELIGKQEISSFIVSLGYHEDLNSEPTPLLA
ncbi:MAG TPA: HD domain-containing phosphohydrolase [Blastocatellia bacterium]|jgi:response regulator RpfG family c-di-GMP phosphodiesterase